MATSKGPDDAGKSGPGQSERSDIRDDDLERRRRALEATLASRLPDRGEGSSTARSGGAAGYGQAMKLSSEFIGGIAVGAGRVGTADQGGHDGALHQKPPNT